MKRTPYNLNPSLDKSIRILFLFVFFSGLCLNSFITPLQVKAASFNPGNLVVYRVGTGTAANTSAAAAVFLDEYTTSGTLVQNLAMPTAVNGSNKRLTASGSATSEGLISRSVDGKYLIVPGYDADPGTASVASSSASTNNRVIGRVDAAGNIDTTTAMNDLSGNIRSAASPDGNKVYSTSSSVGFRYATLGATSSTQLASSPTNLRQAQIFNNQLYFSSSISGSLGINKVGSGLPTTSGQTTTLVIPTGTGSSPYGFQLLDLNPAVDGLDTAYIADDRATGSGGGMQRWNYDGTNWSLAYTLNSGLSTGSRSVIAVNNSGVVTLYATTADSSANKLVTLTENGSDSTFATIATAPINTVYRGVAFAPEGGVLTPTNPTGTGSASPSVVQPGSQVTLTVTVNPGLNPASTGLSVTADLTPIGGSATQAFSANGNTFTYVATVPANASNAPITINFTVSDNESRSSTGTINFEINAAGICGGAFTHTYEVQGNGDTSPLVGSTVTVQGVVIADFEGSSGVKGFYIQDQIGDSDDTTSDGLFIYDPGQDYVSAAGQVVRVTGAISENFNETELTVAASGFVDCGTTATITPTDVTLPFTSSTFPERYEDMLVRLPQNLNVSETYQLGRFNQVTMSSNDRLRQPTQLADPTTTPGTGAQAIQTANDLNQVVVDDGSLVQNLDPITFSRGTYPANQLTASNTLRIGDRSQNITGVMTWEWGGASASPNAWRVRITVNPTFTADNPRPTSPENVGGTIRVAGMNLLNFFNTFGTTACTNGVGGASTDCRGADNQTEFDRQVAKTLSAIEATQADVIAFSEIENDGYGPSSAIQDLVTRLNNNFGAGTYAFINADAETGQTNALGTDAIKVGILYKPAKVIPIGKTAVLNTGAFGLFSTGSGTIGRSRPPLAQTFTQISNNAVFTVVANHLKSKSSACTDNISPVGPDPDIGDGQGNCNLTRKKAAEEETAWLATNPTGINDPDILILGDMNSYAKEDPIKAFENGGYENLISDLIGDYAYSYVFDGQSGYLDHALASDSLAGQVTGITEFHNNADEPTILDYNTEFKSAGQLTSLYAPDEYRASDHDPVLVGLNLNSTITCDPLLVTRPGDDGSGITCGTLSYAIDAAKTQSSSQEVMITLAVPTITLSENLQSVSGNGNPVNLGVACNTIAETPSAILHIRARSGLNAPTTGLTIGSNVRLNGVSITGFSISGINVIGAHNVIACSWVGTSDGVTASGNGAGIDLKPGSFDNSIGIANQPNSGNLISGNTGSGILVEGGSTANEAYYNLVGWASNGTSVLKNGGTAVKVTSGGPSDKPTLKLGPGNRIHA